MMFLTILMPCLNEENTIGECIDIANEYLKKNNIDGEVLISDNNSTDNSCAIALEHNARVIKTFKPGYGSALINGINNAKGKYIIFGDCDMSYDFSDLDKFIQKFDEGYDFVNGNRFSGKIEKHAMPLSHKIGAPILSFLARKKYKSVVHDFHCGLRGFNTEKAKTLNLQCEGMEFATEIIAKFSKGNFKITEVPITLRKDKRNGKPHLNTIKDGIRHLNYIIKN